MRKVRCQSGIKGYECRLQESYSNREEWTVYASLFGLHKRLGYGSIDSAWDENPIIQGSVIPSDFKRIWE